MTLPWGGILPRRATIEYDITSVKVGVLTLHYLGRYLC